jgi:tetratricopeptide (TPR) repeat protein
LFLLRRSQIRMMKSNSIWVMIFFMALSLSCDFTPRINKEILKAQEFVTAQKYKQAENTYLNILEMNPSENLKWKVHYQLGDIYLIHLSRIHKAVVHYEQVLKNVENPAIAIKAEEKLADIYFSYFKDYKKSAKYYYELISFKPRIKNYEFYQFRKAQSLLKISEHEKAEKIFIEIIQNRTHEFYLESYYNLGISYFNRKKWKDAVSVWQEYLKHKDKKQNIVHVKFLMANAYETMEQLKKAYNIYYSLLGEYPNTEVIQQRLNSIYDRRVARKR